MPRGRIQIRPLGGWAGCLMMILFSVVASIVPTVVLNLLLRQLRAALAGGGHRVPQV
jgi:hypothetical protein